MHAVHALLNLAVALVQLAWTILTLLFTILGALLGMGRSRSRAPFTITDAYAIDGDTFAAGETRIRIWGIDAPERNQSGGDQAKGWLRRLAGKGPLSVRPVDNDKYGRIVARVFRDGHDVGLAMIEDGYAIAARQAPRSYHAAETRARRSRTGLWAQGGIADPAAFRAANA